MRRLFCLFALLAVSAAPALANDTTAVLGAGGLIFTRSDMIEMQSEDLFISEEEVRVAYKFRNSGKSDVESIVAFPMPDISGDPYANVALPDHARDNFLDFSVMVDGKAIEPALEQRAFAAAIDVTDLLTAAGVPLLPTSEAIDDRIAALDDATKAEWMVRGLLLEERYDEDGKEIVNHYPTWTLRSTYWWRMKFEADREIDVRHVYKPAVGGTVAVSFLDEGKAKGEQFDEYVTKYCLDKGIIGAVERAAAKNPDGYAPMTETWIRYILTTGGNWSGSIGKFRLTVDKGSEKNLISFCGTGVRKVGPTTFEMTAEDFYPMRDLDFLILKPYDPQ
ncbi:MAG TPA: DUF4424 domain-containing protein [Rhizobiaceae bacterium]|nr:DUF4424 domain-containing protein [Rhizobiaceae bacterium]